MSAQVAEWEAFARKAKQDTAAEDGTTYLSNASKEDILALKTDVHPRVLSLFERPDIEQHSEQWYEARKTMLTASDFPTCLKHNPYKSRKALLRQKLGDKKYQFNGNEATQYGNIMEDVAAAVYAKKYKKHLLWWGLTRHPTIEWLGGSPDRITCDGVLLEIKSPFRREIKDEVPVHYMDQIQGLLFILDLEVCDFVQYRPESLWSPEEFMVTRVERDANWLRIYLPELRKFREDWMHEVMASARGGGCEQEEEEEVDSVKRTRQPRKQPERAVYKFWYPYPLVNAPALHLTMRRYDSTCIQEATGDCDEFFRM